MSDSGLVMVAIVIVPVRPLSPFLVVTIACGALSGFHACRSSPAGRKLESPLESTDR